jgi:flagellar hook-length control protein FliK
MAAAPATPATPATPASHPNEALQRNNDKPATDGVPARNPMAAAPATPATPATPASHPNEALQRNNDRPATDGARPDVRQAGSSHYDHGKRTGESKEGASIAAAAPQKPISTVGDGQAAPERMTPGGSPDKTLLIREAVTETPGSAHDHQQSRNTTPNHRTGLPERDMFPFRMEMPNVASPQETRPAAAAGLTGIDMQSVIDQIVEARRGAGNDFGRIRILLNPPNLGSVDLDIVVRRERVGVVMTAENATVQQALQSRGDDIRIALQRQDLKIEGFQVLLQDNGTGQHQAHGGEMYRQNRENRERFTAGEDASPAIPVFSSIAGVKSAAGLVSIFA